MRLHKQHVLSIHFYVVKQRSITGAVDSNGYLASVRTTNNTDDHSNEIYERHFNCVDLHDSR